MPGLDTSLMNVNAHVCFSKAKRKSVTEKIEVSLINLE